MAAILRPARLPGGPRIPPAGPPVRSALALSACSEGSREAAASHSPSGHACLTKLPPLPLSRTPPTHSQARSPQASVTRVPVRRGQKRRKATDGMGRRSVEEQLARTLPCQKRPRLSTETQKHCAPSCQEPKGRGLGSRQLGPASNKPDRAGRMGLSETVFLQSKLREVVRLGSGPHSTEDEMPHPLQDLRQHSPDRGSVGRTGRD